MRKKRVVLIGVMLIILFRTTVLATATIIDKSGKYAILQIDNGIIQKFLIPDNNWDAMSYQCSAHDTVCSSFDASFLNVKDASSLTTQIISIPKEKVGVVGNDWKKPEDVLADIRRTNSNRAHPLKLIDYKYTDKEGNEWIGYSSTDTASCTVKVDGNYTRKKVDLYEIIGITIVKENDEWWTIRYLETMTTSYGYPKEEDRVSACEELFADASSRFVEQKAESSEQDKNEGNTDKNEGNADKNEGNTDKNEGNADKNEGNADKNEGNADKNEDNADKNEDNADKNENKENVEDNKKVSDNTIAPGKLPQTGLGIGIAVTIVAIVGIGALAYFKYNSYRDVK